MPRGATNGLLPEPVDGHPSRHPQPVINIQPGTVRRTDTQVSASASAGADSDSDDDEDGGLQMQARQQSATTNPRARNELALQYRQQQSRDIQAREHAEDGDGKDGGIRMRHGWDSQLDTPERATLLSQTFFMYFEDKRHETAGNPLPSALPDAHVSEWRMRDRLKTVSALLAVCLNVGVDPPDVIKTDPCARLECWVDPLPPDAQNGGGGGGGGATQPASTNTSNALIGKNLQAQYENLSLRTRYRVILDPTIEELKKNTASARRTAHQERILFHYNGHGVPKPTASGEVWCFNKSYTQYIPVSLYDLQEWVGAPGLWVWDCSGAGGVITAFLDGVAKHTANSAQQEAQRRADPARSSPQQQHQHQQAQQQQIPEQPTTKWSDCIHLAACRANETLPTNPALPADIFTSCLTTPIAMAVRFFLLQNPLPSTYPTALPPTGPHIPGKVSERRTPLGELNWIFTAITDTIAWNCLPAPLFKKLFRQDLMVAALFRNFLLAQRVMRMYHCHPQSWPEVPNTWDHELWRSWDLAVEGILGQLPRLEEQQRLLSEGAAEAGAVGTTAGLNGQPAGLQQPNGPTNQPNGVGVQDLEYQHSTFFADQLTAFEVYLSAAPATPSASNYAKPPAQLPIVLQVLLSQVHRLRALILLSKFLDLGPWAVHLALSIGIFPYVLKLLQSQAVELKPPMVFIWARILAVDSSCQGDLLKDSGFSYFTSTLSPSPNAFSGIALGNVAEHRAMCAFILSMFFKGDFRPGKVAVLESCPGLVESLLKGLVDMENPLLRQFGLLCLGQFWENFQPGKQVGLACQAHKRVCDRSHDPVPEVRAACLDALTRFVGKEWADGQVDAAVVLEEETLASVVVAMGMDGSIMVRKELVVFYSAFTEKYEGRMVVAAWEQLLEERDKREGREEDREGDGLEEVEEMGGGDGANVVNGYAGNGATTSSLNGSRGGGHQHHHQRSNTSTSVSFSASDTTSTTPTYSDPPPSSSSSSPTKPSRTLSKKTIYRAIWRQLLSMSADPHPEVARNASVVVDYVINALLDSPLGEHANAILDELVVRGLRRDQKALSASAAAAGFDRRPQTPPSPAASSTASKGGPGGGEGYFGLARTASVAAAMKTFFGGARTPSSDIGGGGRDGAPPSPTRSHRGSTASASNPYRSRPLTPGDAAMLPPDALDQINGPPHQAKAPVPPSPYFTDRDLSKPPEIPLKSSFFTWSASYFREPQMRPSEADEPGSLDYNERLWRRNRNDKIIASTQPLKDAAGSQGWDVPCGYFGIGAAPVKMVFHQFENHLVTSDDRDSIAVWDWSAERQLARFSNGNPSGSRVTELRFINEDDQAMLMTGSSDGVIKIFRGYDDGRKVQLASAFRALSDLVVSDKRNAGLVFDWQQGQGRILVAGDDRVIRVWQAGHELCIADIPARSGSCITALTSDQVEGNVFVAGFGNGSVRAYDQRMGPRESMIMDWVDRQTDHRSWIVGVHLQRGGLRELVSAESNGGVRLWDIRMKKAVAALPSHYNPNSRHSTSGPNAQSLRSLSVHEHAPVFATGSADHTIRVYNTSELRQLSSFEPYMSYLRLAGGGPRHAPITATAFHPHRMMLACGAVNDGHVNLFKCEAVGEKVGGVVDGGGGGGGGGGFGKGVVEEWGGLKM